LLALGVAFGWPIAAQGTLPDLTGPWALLQVIAETWEVPRLGERLRRVIQVARVRIAQDGERLTLWAEEVCSMAFDLGTPMVNISVAPEFVRTVRVGPLTGRITREGDALGIAILPHYVINGAELGRPEDPLPVTADDPRVGDPDGDGKPGFTVRVRILGLFPGETYVVQRLRQEYRGRVLSPDLIRGEILWEDEQVTLGASAVFFLISGKGRPVPEATFFVLRRLRGEATCAELEAMFIGDLGR
jgi:hypothetical protein